MRSLTYLQEAYARYRRDGVVIGDPDFVWNDAHSPIPKCELGTEMVPLIERDHFIHDLYQSDDYGRCCFFSSDIKSFLNGEGFLCENWFELCDLYEKWAAVISLKAAKKGGKIGGVKSLTLKVGIHDPKNKSKGGRKTVELGVGVHDPKHRGKGGKIGGVKGGKKTVELGIGIHSQTKEERQAAGSKGGKVGGKKAARQKWKCLETGFVTNAGALSRYQKARGIPTDRRVRVSPLSEEGNG
jgi:hypothetical protein